MTSTKRHTYASASKVAETISMEEFFLMVREFNAFILHSSGGQKRYVTSASVEMHRGFVSFARCNRNGFTVADAVTPWLSLYVFEFYNTGRIVRVARPVRQDAIDAIVTASLQKSIDAAAVNS